MRILGTDTAATIASAAVCELSDDEALSKVIVCGSINSGLTHSQTLMPFLESLLKGAGLNLADMDAFAVSAGPGSFTGLRIGVSAVKGMAYAVKKPCRAVSTLLAMAHNLKAYEGLLCVCMDARCDQVYNALFRIKDGYVQRLCEDRALFIPELISELETVYAGEKPMICGDGAELCVRKGMNARLAPPSLRYENAVGVCFAARECPDIEAAALMPIYLRLPQAERERRKKLGLT